jgi:Kef-type K+ transport system membrane component KefB
VLYYLPSTSVMQVPEVVQERLEVIVIRLVHIALPLTLVGTLFTLQHWPNGRALVLLGGALCLVAIALLLRLAQRYPDLKENYQRPIAHLALVLVVAVAITLWVWSLGVRTL